MSTAPAHADDALNPPDTRARTRRILRFAARALAQTWWYELVLPRIGLGAIAARTRTARTKRLAERFHALAVELGGLMIKVGQFMSSRLDVLPPEITKELEGLQDEVPPVPFAAIRARAEAELGMPLDRAYEWFEHEPVAAASLGQAHRATLRSSEAADVGFESVIVKVQRPHIDVIVDVDIAALRRVGQWLSRIKVVSSRVDAPALVEEFAETSRAEIDYLHEASNRDRFAEQFENDERVAVPEIVWERTSRGVLTLADVSAIKINDIAALTAAGIDPEAVANTFAAVMFDQFFEYGFFHADPHPGNVFITPLTEPLSDGSRWRLTFIDFGMMGEIPRTMKEGLRKVVVAVAARDGAGLVAAVQHIGVLLPSADTRELEAALTALFARFGGMGFAELAEVDPREFRDFAEDFSEVVRSLPVQLPDNFLLIVRSMSLTSGVCSGLEPRFNLWNSIEPYAAKLVREESSGFVKDLGAQVLSVASTAWRLPGRVEALIARIERGELEISTPKLDRTADRIEKLARRALSGLLFGVLIIAGAVVRNQDAVLGTTLFVVSIVPLAHAMFAGFFGGRR